MAYCPIGFHTGPGGNPTGIGSYFSALDAARRPAVLKSVDAYGFCRELAALRQNSGVPHVIVFRMSGGNLELPDFSLPAQQSALEHWQRILNNLPPEFNQNNDKAHVWLEVMNEPGKDKAEWIGWFMFHTAELAVAQGYKLCGPGWSTGEPEPADWNSAGWLEYFRLCALHPTQVAVATHEYSLSNSDIMNGNGFLVGRFRQLFAACDAAGIARPGLLITEWGWNADTLPNEATAMQHIRQAAALYRQHPQVMGAATWYLGSGFGGIANQAQKLIAPVQAYALSSEWEGGGGIIGDCRGRPRTQYDRVYQLIHSSVSDAQAEAIFRAALPQRRTTGWSADDAGIGDLDRRTADVFNWPTSQQATLSSWYAQNYPGVTVRFKTSPNQPGRTDFMSTLTSDSGDCRGRPRVPYSRVYQLIHNSLTDDQAVAVFRAGLAQRRTTGWSFDDAGIGDLDDRTVEIFGAPTAERQPLLDWYAQYYPGVNVVFKPAPTPTPNFTLGNPLARDVFITSFFNEPRDYDGDGIPEQKHEGIDFAGLLNGQVVEVRAAQSGTITGIFDQTTGYGRHLLIRHDWPDGHTYVTWYGHLSQILPTLAVGQQVSIGQPLGLTGATGNADGVHLHLNLQHIGHGLAGYVVPDVVDPLPFLQVGPPPPTGDAKMGLHATADPVLAPGEVAAFSTARIELVKCLSNLDPAGVTAIATALPNARWIIRAFLSMAGRTLTPQQFFNDTRSDVQRTLNRLPGRDVVIELHNEPNLVAEGMGTSWADGTAFQAWFLDLLNLYRASFPSVRLLYPGLSPGGSVPGIRQDHAQFMAQSKEAIRAADGLAVHRYWAANFPMSTALQMLDETINFLRSNNMGQKPIWVTEASNNKGGTTPAGKGAEYVRFWQELRQRPTLQGVTYFVASANHPDFQEEVWVTGGSSRGIAEVVGAR